MKVAPNTKSTVAPLDVQSIREISERAFWDGLEILAVIELLKSGNRSRVQESFNKSGTRFAADIIKRALLVHLTFLVARAHGGGKVWPGDRDARAVFEQLKRNPAIANNMQSPADLAEARRRWNRCQADPRRKRVRDYRDKYVAHYGNPQSALPQYREMFGFARATAAALEKLAHGTGVARFSHCSQLQARKVSAKKFWDHLARPLTGKIKK
jgi:hypothetical protein